MSRGTACVLWHTVDSSQHAHSLYVRLMSTGRGRVQLSWSRGALRCSFALLTFSFKNPRVLIRCCIAAVTDRPAIVLAVGGKREVRPACFRWSLGGRGRKSPLETESSGLEEQSEQACKRADRICKQSRTAEYSQQPYSVLKTVIGFHLTSSIPYGLCARGNLNLLSKCWIVLPSAMLCVL